MSSSNASGAKLEEEMVLISDDGEDCGRQAHEEDSREALGKDSDGICSDIDSSFEGESVKFRINRKDGAQVTLGRTRTKGRTPCFVYVVAAFSIIGGFLFGYDTGVIAGAILELDKDFALDSTRKELVVSVTLAAAAVGALVGGPTNERFGRKKTIMIASLIFTAGSIVMAAIPTGGSIYEWGWIILLVGRFMVGVGVGLASMTVPIYLAECAPTHLRGRLTVADNMAITGGQFVAGIVDFSFSYTAHGWRYMLGLAAIPAIVRFVAFFFLPESPRWLVTKGKVGRAREVLERLRPRGSQVEEELEQIQEDLRRRAVENKRGALRKLLTMLTTRHLLLALVVGCGIQAIQQLSGINTVMYYSPTILKMAGVVDNHSAIGFGALIAFGNFVFTLIGMYFVEKSGRRKLILVSLSGVIVSLVVLGAAFFVANGSSPVAYSPVHINETTGVCHTYGGCLKWSNCDDCVIDDQCHYCLFNGSFGSESAIGICVHSDDRRWYDKRNRECLLPANGSVEFAFRNGTCNSAAEVQSRDTFEHCPSRYSWLTLVALCMYIVAFSPGMGPVPWTVTAEIYPNWARSVGNSVSTTTNWVTNLLVAVTFLHLTRYLTRYGAFWLYTGIAICSWIFLFLMLPETKGRTLEQVEELFQRPLCPPLGINEMPCTKKAYYRLQEDTKSRN